MRAMLSRMDHRPSHAAARMLCLGGATIDRSYAPLGQLLRGSSNPVVGRTGFGGVARNVAETIARLGVHTALVAAIGGDAAGTQILDHLTALGIDLRAIARRPDQVTAQYIAVLDEHAALAYGLSDMAILETLTLDEVARACSSNAGAAWIFADCNLTTAALSWLIAHARENPVRLALDAVSMAKTERLPRDLRGVDLLFLNRDEGGALTRLASDASAGQIAAAVRDLGAAAVAVTLGDAGVALADGTGVTILPAVPAKAVDPTGAGDALIAGTLWRLLAGDDLASALRVGTLAATLTIESESSVRNDMTPELLMACMSRLDRRDGSAAS